MPADPTNSMNGQMFSTWDRDQDSSAGSHCAQDMQAGWWFSDCGLANPNGVWAFTGNYSRNLTVPSIWWGVGQFSSLAIEEISFKLKGSNI